MVNNPMKQTHIIFFSIIIIIILIIGAVGSFFLIKKGIRDLGARPVRTTALTAEGEYIIAKQFNEKFKNSAERYSDIGDVVSVAGRDIVVKLIAEETLGERTIRIADDVVIERLTTTVDGQFRENARVSDIKQGDRLVYYYVQKTDPVIAQAIQILGNFSQ